MADREWQRYVDPARVARGVRARARPLRRLARLRRRWLFLRRQWLTPMEMRAVRLDELGLADENRVNHIPSPWKTLPRILPPDEVGPDDVMLDLGSGMGRIV